MLKYQQLAPNFHLVTNFSPDRYKTEFNIQFTAGGAFFEQKGERGVSHLLEHCLVGRTKELNFNGLKDHLFQENIYSNAATGVMGMYLTLSGHRTDSIKMLDLILEFAFAPTLTREIQDQEREIVLREISERSGDPTYRLYWQTMRRVYQPGSRYLCEVLGLPEEVRDASIATFQSIRDRMLAKSHFILSVSGGEVEVSTIKKAVQSRLSHVPATDVLEVNYMPGNSIQKFDYLPVVSDLAHEHAEISLYLPCPVNITNRPVRYFVQELFMKHPEGYLFNRLRNELGWVYGLHSAFDQSTQTLNIEMSCEIKYVDKIVEEVRLLFSDFAKVFKAEKAKILQTIAIKKQEMTQDEPQAVADFLIDNLTDFGVPMSFAEYVTQLAKVTSTDIEDIFTQIQNGLPQMQVVAVSNKSEIEQIKV